MQREGRLLLAAFPATSHAAPCFSLFPSALQVLATREEVLLKVTYPTSAPTEPGTPYVIVYALADVSFPPSLTLKPKLA